MAIRTKGRRRIVVDGVRYVWWGGEEHDHPVLAGLPVVSVASEDKTLIVRYHVGQPDDTRHVEVIGPRFRGRLGPAGRHRRYSCPRFGGDSRAITPSLVAALVRWCMEAGEDAVEVDYRGVPLSEA